MNPPPIFRVQYLGDEVSDDSDNSATASAIEYLTLEGLEISASNELASLLRYWGPLRKPLKRACVERGGFRWTSEEAVEVPKEKKWVKEIKARRRHIWMICLDGIQLPN
jgi:hypothetical protein